MKHKPSSDRLPSVTDILYFCSCLGHGLTSLTYTEICYQINDLFLLPFFTFLPDVSPFLRFCFFSRHLATVVLLQQRPQIRAAISEEYVYKYTLLIPRHDEQKRLQRTPESERLSTVSAQAGPPTLSPRRQLLATRMITAPFLFDCDATARCLRKKGYHHKRVQKA